MDKFKKLLYALTALSVIASIICYAYMKEQIKQIDKLIEMTNEYSATVAYTPAIQQVTQIAYKPQKAVTMYDNLLQEQKGELAAIIVSASGCESYRQKYLVACVIRNRVEHYGINQVLTSGHVEPPFILTDETIWEFQERQRQFEDSARALKQAFTCNDYLNLRYYQNPTFSTADGLEFFSQFGEAKIIEGNKYLVYFYEGDW